MSAFPAANLLGAEASPYLLQHKDNPVHWRPWGPAVFAEAKQTGKPILLSIGYAACHWCHVMAHESFEDESIAAEMNRRYVNVKVDREERPDVDALYQNALALLGQNGGWPLTMFLTPQGEPFWGGTYFPPDDKWGKPGFKRVLARIDELYRREPEKIGRNVAALREALAQMAQNAPGGKMPVAALDAVAAHVLDAVDLAKGGLAGAPKFPQTSVFELLWRAWRRGGDPRLKEAVLVTLDRMADGGIYDHLGGGFARYSTDAEWLAPHFEKMLYDNAQLVRLYALAWQETRSPLYAERVAETIGWLAREMRDPLGGFYGSLDADSEGEEGKFYVWSEAEIDAALGAEAGPFKAAYDVTAAGNWEGKTILRRSLARRRLPAPLEAKLAAARAKLLAVRDTRIRPGLDDKVLADWNGLAIAALARAARIFDRPDWLALAQGAFDFVVARMSEGGRLKHAWRQGRLQHPATLDDYACMAEGALALFEATGEAGALAQARAWAEIAELHFRDAERGGYFLSADDVTDLPMRGKTAFDNATPSGNGVLAQVQARLFHLTGEAVWRERAEALLAAFAGDLEKRALGMPHLLMARELLGEAVQIVVAGPDAAARAALAAAAWRAPLPNAVIQELADGAALPRNHPAQGKTVAAGAAAFVCRGPTCSLPLTDPAELAVSLSLSPLPETQGNRIWAIWGLRQGD